MAWLLNNYKSKTSPYRHHLINNLHLPQYTPVKNQQPFNNEAALSKPWNISSSLSMFVCLLILNFITLRCLQHQHLTVNRWKISSIETLPSVTVEGIPPTKIFFVRKSFEFQPAAPLGIVRLISTYKQNYSMHQLSFPSPCCTKLLYKYVSLNVLYH